MQYLTFNLLLKSNVNLSIYLIGAVVLLIVIFLINKTIKGFRDNLGKVLADNDKKIEFLKKKFKNRIDVLESNEISAEIVVEQPDTINKPWKVIKVAYTGNSLSKKASNTVSKNVLIISDSDLEKSMANSGEFVIVNKHLQHVNVYQKALKELNK